MDTNSGYEPRTDLPSRRDFIRGSSLVGVGAATAGLVGCSTPAQDDAAPENGDRRLFNGLSAESSEIYPFEYKELEINGRRIHYVDEGQWADRHAPPTGRATGRITIGA